MIRTYDAIVIGSGATGGWAAMVLTRAGLDVAVLEAGPMLAREQMYAKYLPPGNTPLKRKLVPEAAKKLKPISAKHGLLSESTHHLYVDETEHPYSTPAHLPFSWIRGRQVGGKSLLWGRLSPRLTDFEFHANREDGHGEPWPLDYAELKPYYDRVEGFIGVAGKNEGNPAELPDGVFLPPFKLNRAEAQLLEVTRSRFRRVASHVRSATLTRDLNGRSGLYTPARALRGLQPEAFFSSVASTLPAADSSRLTLSPNTIVSHLIADEADPTRIRGAWCVDREDPSKHFEVRGRMVFLCASALESTRILLNSRSRHHPDGLGNSSGVLGKYLTDHPIRMGASGTLPASIAGARDTENIVTKMAGVHIPRFRNLGRPDPTLGFLRGYYLSAGARPTLMDAASSFNGFGVALKEKIGTGSWAWRMSFDGIGEALPRATNFVGLDPGLKDRWGIPALHIHYEFTDNERRMFTDAVDASEELLRAIGATDIQRTPSLPVPGTAIHETGTARMGDNRKTSYLNRWNQSHDVSNVFVTDGACMPSSGNQNPTLTLMALTLRASEHAVRELRAGRI